MGKTLPDQDTPQAVLEEQDAERQQAREALRASEERFRKVFEHSNDAILVVNPGQDEIIDVNPKACALLGFTREELLSRRVSDVHPAEMLRVRVFAESVFEKGYGWTDELTCLTKSGEVLAAEISASVIEMDDQEYMIALVRDITARKQAEEALRKAHDELEQRVEERTAALLKANEELKAEIAARKQAEQALRRFAWVFEHTRSGVVTASGETFELVNPAFARMHGYTVEELTGEPIAQVFPPEIQDRVPALIQAANEKGHVTYEVPHRRKDGTVFPALVQVTAVKDEHGNVVERIATILDITERKQAEEALREREESFRLMFANNPVPMWVFDEETLVFLAVNEAAVRHYGFSREEFLTMTIKDIRPPEEVAGLVDYLSTRRDKRRRVWEWKHQKKDGTIIYVEIASHGLMFAGRQARLVLANVITDRKKAEEKLRRYARRLETLQELDRAILAARSPEAIAEAALEHIEQLVSYWYGSVVLVDFEAHAFTVLATHAQGQARYEAGVRLPLEAGRIPEEHARGEVYVVEDFLEIAEPDRATQGLMAEGLRSGISVPLIARGRQIGALMLGLDRPGAFRAEHIVIAREVADSVAIAIQQARLREQVERHAAELEQRVAERTDELEAFSYSVSHDLRTPLRAIDGFSRVLVEEHADALDDECRRLIHIIRSNARNMGQLIDGLLALSRLGRREMRLCDVDIHHLAEEVYDDLQATTEGRTVHFALQSLPPARGDRSMLRQVFVNLLTNALKFTRPRAQARIEVGVAVEHRETTYYVKDNGVGFDQAYVDKLFGVFQRLHTTGEFEGTGVGLALVERIIGRHGGRVWAEGRLDEGATIYFTLPREKGKPC